MTDHWVRLEQTATAGRIQWDRTAAHRSVCTCGWQSDALATPAEAVEAGLSHTADAKRYV